MNVRTFRDLCDSVMSDPAYRPQEGVTFCNAAVYKIAFPFGYDFYDPKTKDLLLANQIIDWMRNNWQQVDGETANAIANAGEIAIACQYAQPHGHVCVIYAGAMVYSSKWKKEVPVVANVGERNGVMGCNWAFRKEPLYFTDQKNTDTQR